jgi:hypothetical protein
MARVCEDFETVRRQITEYGSVDLEMMGIGLLEASKQTVPDPYKVGMEMALIFYLQGKVSRCVSAIAAGQMPSNDTLKDIRVYAFMLGHVREFGHWRIEGANGSGMDDVRAEPQREHFDFEAPGDDAGGTLRSGSAKAAESYPPRPTSDEPPGTRPHP